MINQFEKLIENNNIELAIQLLINFLKESPKLNDVLLQSARYTDITKAYQNGLIDYSESSLNKNKVVNALLAIKDEIKSQLDSNKEIKEEYFMKRFSVDKKILTILKIAQKRREETTNKLIPLEILIPLLDSLFERMTFRGEPKIEMCTKQRWIERVHSAHLTYEAILTFEDDFQGQGDEIQKKLFSEVLISVSKYVDRMLLGLFEESKIHLKEIDSLIGTSDFITKFKENGEKRFQLSEDGRKILVEDKFRKPINTHLKNSISNMDKLRNTVNQLKN